MKRSPTRLRPLRAVACAGGLAALALLSACDQLFPYRSPGEIVYRKNCAECHGLDGAGNTPNYMGNAWADLRDNEWHTGPDAGAIKAVVESGVFGEMPGYTGKLSREEIDQVVDYVRVLRGDKAPEPRPQ
ncbi:MAG TPA: cytochrome c [Thermoanaerobaculia bacterium]|nr:cytochrome c [Thermoanaerobaculia bacterium]